MRTIGGACRWDQTACPVDEGTDGVRVVDLSRDQNRQVIGHTDEAAIEHPVGRARKRDPVAEEIGTILFDGADMRCFNLGPTSAVDELEPTQGAAFVVCVKNNPAEIPVADDAGSEVGGPIAALLDLKRRLRIFEAGNCRRLSHTGQIGLVRRKTQIDNPDEVVQGKWPHRGLSAAREPAVCIQDTALDQTVRSAKRDGIAEIEVASRFDNGDEHAGCFWIGDDFLDLGDREVSSRRDELAGLVVYDPVADTAFDATEVLSRELIALCRDIVIDGV